MYALNFRSIGEEMIKRENEGLSIDKIESSNKKNEGKKEETSKK